VELQQLDIFLRLLIAHVLADFFFQTNTIAQKKKDGLRSRHFYIHILTVGILTYIILAQWGNWWVPLAMMAMHGFIDWLKAKSKLENLWGFLADQFLHIATIFMIWIILSNNTIPTFYQQLSQNVFNENTLLVITAYLILTFPASILTGHLTKKWQKEVLISEQDESLTDAGKWIGILERFLILTFIIMQQWMAIGFLLAAKSVFRFGDLKESRDRKKTEYILIGTLLSFTLAITTGIIVNYFLH
jgi:disulfide bond formation protein DsbB